MSIWIKSEQNVFCEIPPIKPVIPTIVSGWQETVLKTRAAKADENSASLTP